MENQRTVKTFGVPTGEPKPPIAEGTPPEAPKAPEAKPAIPEATPPKETTETAKPVEGKTQEAKKPEEQGKKPEAQKPDGNGGEEGKQPFKAKVTFDNEGKVEVKTETQKPETSKPQETVSVTEETVLEFLKNKGVKATSIADLSKPQNLPEAVEAFKKFHEETGRDSQAFVTANKDWTKEPKDNVIKEFYKYKNPNISDESIQTKIDLLRVTDEDKEDLEPRDYRSRKLKYDETHEEALAFMQKISQDHKAPKIEYATAQQKPLTEEEIAELHKPYWNSRDKSLSKMNEFKMNVEGLGEIKVNISEEHKLAVSKNTETQDAFFERWKTKDGNIDTDKSTLDTAWSIPEVRQKFISDIIEQTTVLALENLSKDMRNVNLTDPNKTQQSVPQVGGLQVSGSSKSSGMGTPLIPQRKN